MRLQLHELHELHQLDLDELQERQRDERDELNELHLHANQMWQDVGDWEAERDASCREQEADEELRMREHDDLRAALQLDELNAAQSRLAGRKRRIQAELEHQHLRQREVIEEVSGKHHCLY